MKRRYKGIVLFICIIIGMWIAVIILNSPNAILAQKNTVTKATYGGLEIENEMFAVSFDKEAVIKSVAVDYYFKNDKLIITTENKFAKVIGKYPIINQELDVVSGTMKLHGKVDKKNVQFQHISKVKSKYFYLSLAIIAYLLISVGGYNAILRAYDGLKKKNLKKQ